MSNAPGQQTLIPGISATIRELIVQGRLKAGEVIHQTELAKELGVSPVPLREALRRLESEGLVTFLPYRGTIVSPFSIGEAREIYALGNALAALMIPAALPRMRPSDLETLKEAALRLDDGTGDLDTLRTFYTTLFRPADMPLALEMAQNLVNRTARLFTLSSANRVDLRAVKPTRMDLAEAMGQPDVDHALAVFREFHRIREEGILRLLGDRP
ncbi:MAG TPA: GntR family transcriptional regulator [Holophagaceae bacterium]|nr:GntR family transcriptional regulator [Holophagaceae bacterium]